MFNPQGFPDGHIIWDLTTSVDREHEYLETFELHRRTFVVVAVADYGEKPDPEVLSQQLEDLKSLVSSTPTTTAYAEGERNLMFVRSLVSSCAIPCMSHLRCTPASRRTRQVCVASRSSSPFSCSPDAAGVKGNIDTDIDV
jgi:hypothetical protein